MSSESDYLFDCGVVVRADTALLTDREAIVSAVCHHYLLSGIIAELEQLKRGLNTLHLLTLMEEFPQKFMSIFNPSDAPLSSEQLEDMLKVNYTEEGSNQRTTEERIVLHFFNFLRDVKEGIGCFRV